MNPELYGQGVAFPPRMGTLGLVQSSGPQKIAESIQIILGTQYGERVMRPRFGCNLRSLVFAPNNGATANLARYYVEEGLRRWEPRIELLDVAVTNDNAHGQLYIDITYRLRATQDVHSFGFPFSLERPQ
jgi:phage baseplate assembly protein W